MLPNVVKDSTMTVSRKWVPNWTANPSTLQVKICHDGQLQLNIQAGGTASTSDLSWTVYCRSPPSNSPTAMVKNLPLTISNLSWMIYTTPLPPLKWKSSMNFWFWVVPLAKDILHVYHLSLVGCQSVCCFLRTIQCSLQPAARCNRTRCKWAHCSSVLLSKTIKNCFTWVFIFICIPSC